MQFDKASKNSFILLSAAAIVFSACTAKNAQAGSIVAWGSNGDGQCDVPAPNTGFVAIAAGLYHSLGLKAEGSIVAWGWNDSGQCDVPSPNTGFVAVAAGREHSLGLKADGSIVAWGSNGDGQCDVPAPNTGFVAIAAGQYHSLGLKVDGSIVVWGLNNNGENDVPAPNAAFVAIAAGLAHSLGLKADGSIVAWGRNWVGQCDVPAPNTGFISITGAVYNSFGLKTDGSVVGWGDYISLPSPNTDFVAVAAGESHRLGLKADGSIVAWGSNSSGQCDVPVPNTGFVAVAAGRYHSLALKLEVNVPNVVGMSHANAESAITNAGFYVGTVMSQWSDTVPKGYVISQIPPAGTLVPIGSAVGLWVSLGPFGISEVPDVVGMTQAGATSAITSARLAVGTIAQTYSNTAPTGKVLSQNPAPGAEVNAGSAVNLVISIGPATTTLQMSGQQDIPDMDYVLLEKVVTGVPGTARVAGVSYKVLVDDRGNAGDFWCSDYEIYLSSHQYGGTSRYILIWDNKGGTTDQNADDDAENDSDIYLERSTNKFNGENPNQKWYVCVIDNGTKHDLSRNGLGRLMYVTLTISYETPSGVPNVVGMTRPNAESAIANADLVVGAEWYQGSYTVPEGHVISQDPTAGTGVAIGSAVNMVISLSPLADGLVAHWKLDETVGTIARDSSGNEHHGALYGAPVWQPTAGKIGGALLLDGIDDHVETNYAENLATWTVSVWVMSPAPPAGGNQTGPVQREQNYRINWDHYSEVFRGAADLNVGGSWYAASFGPLEANTWYHLAASYDGESLRAYRNGALITTNETPSGNPTAEAATLKLGRHAIVAQYFAGKIDDVRLYNRSISPGEITQLSCTEPPRGDLNNDCRVNFTDLAILASEWLTCALPEDYLCWQ